MNTTLFSKFIPKKPQSAHPSGEGSGASVDKDLRLQQVEILKKMCRLLGRRRRKFLEDDWRKHAKKISLQQFIHLTMVRSALPCNLAKIMQMTGLTSAGASIFVNKLVNCGIFERQDDPDDRRNVIIRFTPEAAAISANVEDRLNRYIVGFFDDCTEEELATLDSVARMVCRVLGPDDEETTPQAAPRKRSRN